jgi:hypothetical protein
MSSSGKVARDVVASTRTGLIPPTLPRAGSHTSVRINQRAHQNGMSWGERGKGGVVGGSVTSSGGTSGWMQGVDGHSERTAHSPRKSISRSLSVLVNCGARVTISEEIRILCYSANNQPTQSTQEIESVCEGMKLWDLTCSLAVLSLSLLLYLDRTTAHARKHTRVHSRCVELGSLRSRSQGLSFLFPLSDAPRARMRATNQIS